MPSLFSLADEETGALEEATGVISEDTNIAPEIDFIETDASVLSADLVSRFEDFTGEKLYEGDERRIFLQGFAYVLTDIMIHINETGRENLLQYATDTKLDALGELYGNSRLAATYAKTTIRFHLATSPDSSVIVPKGTRVTADGSLFFATDAQIIFPAKTTTLQLDVGATATTAGAAGNEIEVGDIDSLVDGVPYISSVENITVTSGGSDTESDEDYRERLKLSPFSFSVAGPSNAYKMIALSVSNDVGDVSVYSPSAGVVEIAVIKEGGIVPTAEDELLDEILAACSAKDRRPLTDKVQVVPATAVNTTINARYYVSSENLSKVADIEAAVDEYKTWQTEKIGRDINPDQLKKLMMDAGAARVDITTPTYVSMSEKQVAVITSTSVNYGGTVNV